MKMPASEDLKARVAEKKIIREKRAARRVVEHAATVAAAAVSRANGSPPLPDPEADFGDDIPDEAPLPALPPRPTRPEDKAAPPSDAMVAMAKDVPDDPLAAMAVLQRMLVQSAREAVLDTDLTPRERRKELRTISVAADRLVPKSRLFEAEQIVLKEKRKLESRDRHRGGAKLQPLRGRKSTPDFGE